MALRRETMVLALSALIAGTAGCSAINSLLDPDAGTGPGGAGDAAGGGPGMSTFKLAFAPSNVPSSAVLTAGAEVALSTDCTIDGKAGKITCAGAAGSPTDYGYTLVSQTDPDQSKMALFTFAALRVDSAARVAVTGDYPVALVARDTIRINAGLAVTVDGVHANAGGFSGQMGTLPGFGPGAGGAGNGSAGNGGGGAGFCGQGGPGGPATTPGMNGGKSYGNPEIKPLMGGSSGGAVEYGNGGGGGGAIQLVAGTSIDVGITGTVSAPGGGGGFVGSGGGGSGGALLLEAPMVRVAGVVAANGGGGGTSQTLGQPGAPSAQPAAGGNGTNPAGNGSAGTMIDGAAGGAGGGGAGRIRINTTTGTADTSGTLSPAASTPCATQGKLAAVGS